jgi:hypothetical protein
MRVGRGLKSDQPLLVGHLVILDAGLRSTRPHLGVDVWCPYCHRDHHHGWEDLPFRLDAASHRVAHCPHGSPFDEGGYHVGLDPSPAGLADYRRVIREFAAILDRWTPAYARRTLADVSRRICKKTDRHPPLRAAPDERHER